MNETNPNETIPAVGSSDWLADKEFMNALNKVSEAILKAGQDLLELREALRDQTPHWR